MVVYSDFITKYTSNQYNPYNSQKVLTDVTLSKYGVKQGQGHPLTLSPTGPEAPAAPGGPYSPCGGIAGEQQMFKYHWFNIIYNDKDVSLPITVTVLGFKLGLSKSRH